MHKNICTKRIFGVRAKILWNCQIQTDKLVMANQPVIVVVNKQRKAVLINVAMPSDCRFKKKRNK